MLPPTTCGTKSGLHRGIYPVKVGKLSKMSLLEVHSVARSGSLIMHRNSYKLIAVSHISPE